MLTSLHLNKKHREVCIKARSPPASLAFIGQVTKHTTVKWPIEYLTFTWQFIEKRNIYIYYSAGALLFWERVGGGVVVGSLLSGDRLDL